MAENIKDRRSGCPLMSRRSFVGSLGAAAACTQLGIFDFASSLFAAPGKPAKKPVVRVAFAGPDVDRYWMGWPGADWDNPAHMKRYTEILKEAAGNLGVNLRVRKERVWNKDTNSFLEEVKKEKPDGLLLVCLGLHPNAWRVINPIAKKRGNIPTIVFSPVGTSFTADLQATRNIDGVFVGSTQHEDWLRKALRMLYTVWRMKHTRLCILRGNKTRDQKADHLGTTLHYIPESRFPKLFKQIENTDEVRSIADYYEKNAKAMIEPSKKDILNAAKNYVVCRRIMEQEKCDGISINCLPLISSRTVWPPCIAYSRLRDEGVVGACEADVHAALGSRLTHLLCERPGFMQDPAPLTVSNTLVGAHCTSPTKLAGFDKPPAPFLLRTHQESDLGVAPQVLWPVGEKMTIMDLLPPNTMRVGPGKVVSNIEHSPEGHDPYEEAGGCRTSVEVEVEGVEDVRDVKGFHQLFILGDLEYEFKAYAQLANIKVEHI